MPLKKTSIYEILNNHWHGAIVCSLSWFIKWRYQRERKGGGMRVENQGGIKWGGDNEEEKTWIMEFSHNIYLENTWRVVGDVHNYVTTMFMKMYSLGNLRWHRILGKGYWRINILIACAVADWGDFPLPACHSSLFCVIWAQVATQ